MGRVASVYYLQHSTVALFATAMNARNSFEDLLEILAGAAEYDELPVRHNEDLLCADLAAKTQKAGGFGVDARRLDDPHVKANLLFQAHWLRVPLPSSDFVTDAKGALDNAVRVHGGQCAEKLEGDARLLMRRLEHGHAHRLVQVELHQRAEQVQVG